MPVLGPPGCQSGTRHIRQQQLGPTTGLPACRAVGCGHTAQPVVGQVALAAAEVGIRHEQLVLVRPRGHQVLVYKVEAVHVGRGHHDQVGTQQCQTAGVFGELHVITNQQAELPAVEVKQRLVARAGAEHAQVQVAEELGFAVAGEAAALGIDALGSVKYRAIAIVLGVAEDDGDLVPPGDGRHGLGTRAVGRLGRTAIEIEQAAIGLPA